MAMKRIVSGICAFLACVFAAAAIAAAVFCREKTPALIQPSQEAVRHAERFMEAVCNGEFDLAQTMIQGQPDLGTGKELSSAAGQRIWDAYVQSLDYELVGGLYATQTGLVQNVKIIGLELSTATEEVGQRARMLLNAAVDAAKDVTELYDAQNNYREDLVMDLLDQAVRAALEEDVRYGYQVIPLQLVYEDGSWWVAGDRNLFSAISGGLTQTGDIVGAANMYMANVTSDALEGILSVEKVYWLQDEDPVAPRPNPEKYGETVDPRDLKAVIENAGKLLEGQDLIFQTDTELREGSAVTYYCDETILCITWQ